MMGMPSSRSDCRFSSSSMTPVNNTAAGRSARSEAIMLVSLA